MNSDKILGYQPGNSFIHRLNATTKLIFLLVVSIACMVTYDTRFLILVCIFSIACLKIAGIKWHQISFIVKFIIVFAVINLIAVYIFQPTYGQNLYGTKHVVFNAGYFTLTQEELFYLFNLILKYICSVPLVLLFLLTTNPSQFASSLNKIGVSYKISYAVSLALRYIPTIQTNYWEISAAQQARGNELSKKASLGKRIKGTLTIVIPLIFSSLDRIDTISTAMQLRRFGSKKKRTWYVYEPFQTKDYLVTLLAFLLVMLVVILWQVNNGRFFNPFK
ncbi:energy-coupling factor transporter transmembrane component T family protein [Lactobacillus kalixensis]|uniref:ABC-type cobalt transport system, permease component CbiQ related transporter n=1 Tax=Lactobacillus kalixensis DSM 16043 TaxID=1423763 RepID=A0A0R1UA50_9LACO|nr:energy-coupling factor transporter transmembrane component T [Lactobacillus kalixensis]KRL90230.1 ABC-type cobalt transport system, permease component CbiQ related transporter [Lactobacillus kalixensis DSM 16043]